jgi:DNA-binding GntR family transcriptional regulator
MPIDGQPLTKTEAALRSIRARIHSGDLAAGSHLQVKDLAQELGMSHTPVREALRVLSADGLVEIRTHRGAVVATATDRLAETWPLRALLEPEAVRRAVPLAPEPLARLEHLHAELSAGPVLQRSTQNQTWHFALYEQCGSPILVSFISRLWELVPWRTVWMLPGRADTSTQEHVEVMEAIRAGDGELAAERMRTHILSAFHDVVDLPDDT